MSDIYRVWVVVKGNTYPKQGTTGIAQILDATKGTYQFFPDCVEDYPPECPKENFLGYEMHGREIEPFPEDPNEEIQFYTDLGKRHLVGIIGNFLCIGMFWLGFLSGIDAQMHTNPLDYHPCTKWILNITDKIIEELK